MEVYGVEASRENVEEAIKYIGGCPSIIYDLLYQYSLCRDFDRALESIVDRALVNVYNSLNYIITEKGLGKERVFKLIENIVDKPVYIRYILGRQALVEAIDYLVSKNILQYACREYVGVYKWSSSSTGGLCSLDIVVPSSRLYLNVLKEVVKET